MLLETKKLKNQISNNNLFMKQNQITLQIQDNEANKENISNNPTPKNFTIKKQYFAKNNENTAKVENTGSIQQQEQNIHKKQTQYLSIENNNDNSLQSQFDSISENISHLDTQSAIYRMLIENNQIQLQNLMETMKGVEVKKINDSTNDNDYILFYNPNINSICWKHPNTLFHLKEQMISLTNIKSIKSTVGREYSNKPNNNKNTSSQLNLKKEKDFYLRIITKDKVNVNFSFSNENKRDLCSRTFMILLGQTQNQMKLQKANETGKFYYNFLMLSNHVKTDFFAETNTKIHKTLQKLQDDYNARIMQFEQLLKAYEKECLDLKENDQKISLELRDITIKYTDKEEELKQFEVKVSMLQKQNIEFKAQLEDIKKVKDSSKSMFSQTQIKVNDNSTQTITVVNEEKYSQTINNEEEKSLQILINAKEDYSQTENREVRESYCQTQTNLKEAQTNLKDTQTQTLIGQNEESSQTYPVEKSSQTLNISENNTPIKEQTSSQKKQQTPVQEKTTMKISDILSQNKNTQSIPTILINITDKKPQNPQTDKDSIDEEGISLNQLQEIIELQEQEITLLSDQLKREEMKAKIFLEVKDREINELKKLMKSRKPKKSKIKIRKQLSLKGKKGKFNMEAQLSLWLNVVYLLGMKIHQFSSDLTFIEQLRNITEEITQEYSVSTYFKQFSNDVKQSITVIEKSKNLLKKTEFINKKLVSNVNLNKTISFETFSKSKKQKQDNYIQDTPRFKSSSPDKKSRTFKITPSFSEFQFYLNNPEPQKPNSNINHDKRYLNLSNWKKENVPKKQKFHTFQKLKDFNLKN